MTKMDLVNKLHNKWQGKPNQKLTKKLVMQLVDGVFENVGLAVKKERRFSYPGFGTFALRNRKARKGRNPQTGESINIKASKTVGFRPAKLLKGKL